MSLDTVGNTFTMTFELKVVDNFLSQKHYNKLLEEINNNQWFYDPVVVFSEGNIDPVDRKYASPDTLDQYQFVLPIHHDGLIHNRAIVEIFSHYILPRSWVKIKANFSPKRTKIIKNDLHIDTNYGDLTAIYYLNSNNGYSYFEGGKSVNSVANRIVIFPRETYHSGTTATTDHRKVINLNYFGSVAE